MDGGLRGVEDGIWSDESAWWGVAIEFTGCGIAIVNGRGDVLVSCKCKLA